MSNIRYSQGWSDIRGIFGSALQNEPDYYAKRKYGKYTIYNKEGWRVAWGLNKKEMDNYMKLLKKEE